MIPQLLCFYIITPAVNKAILFLSVTYAGTVLTLSQVSDCLIELCYNRQYENTRYRDIL